MVEHKTLQNRYHILQLGVIRNEILDKIGKIAHVISFQILRELLNDTTVGDISLKRPGCGVNKQLS